MAITDLVQNNFGVDVSGLADDDVQNALALAGLAGYSAMQPSTKVSDTGSPYYAQATQAIGQMHPDVTTSSSSSFWTENPNFQKLFGDVGSKYKNWLMSLNEAPDQAANMAKISTAYQTGLKNALAGLSQRGLSGSGLEASTVQNMAMQQAQAQAQERIQSLIRAAQLQGEYFKSGLPYQGQMASTSSSQSVRPYDQASAYANLGHLASGGQGQAYQLGQLQKQSNQADIAGLAKAAPAITQGLGAIFSGSSPEYNMGESVFGAPQTYVDQTAQWTAPVVQPDFTSSFSPMANSYFANNFYETGI